MSRRRVHAGIALVGVILTVALITAGFAMAALLAMGHGNGSTAGHAQADQSASSTPSAPPAPSAKPVATTPAAPSTTVVNKDAVARKVPSAIDVNIGDCAQLGSDPTGSTVSKTACGSPGASYKIFAKSTPGGCPHDADRTYTAGDTGALCMDIDWVVGKCMDMSAAVPKPVDCGGAGTKKVRVIEIKQSTDNVNECTAGDHGYVYNQRRFVVCVAGN